MFDISLDHVSKRYLIKNGTRERSIGWPTLSSYRKKETWALRDVSLEVQEGETVGIIGNNGAGKSTILKLLSRITAPTSGEIKIRGRLAALIEVGSGFHPELTGRENIFLNASMLGMARSDTDRKLDSIIEFSGISEYIDVPVKRYSSGMYVRLGFSIAAHLDPDIILLDEVLAVGDLAFQAKCLAHIERLQANGRTIVFISHDLGAIQRLCDRAILLHQGRIIMDSAPMDVVDHYQQMSMEPLSYQTIDEVGRKSATCSYISFASAESEETPRTGYPMVARFGFHAHMPLEDVVFNVLIYWPSGYLCTQLTTAVSDSTLRMPAGAGEIEFYCPVLEIQPGWYRVDISIESNGAYLDRHQRCSVVRVRPGKMVFGDFYMDSTWRIKQSPPLRASINGQSRTV